MDSVIRCPSCGQANRVRELAGGEKAVCAKCKTPLDATVNGDGHPVTVSDSDFKKQIAQGAAVVDGRLSQGGRRNR